MCFSTFWCRVDRCVDRVLTVCWPCVDRVLTVCWCCCCCRCLLKASEGVWVAHRCAAPISNHAPQTCGKAWIPSMQRISIGKPPCAANLHRYVPLCSKSPFFNLFSIFIYFFSCFFCFFDEFLCIYIYIPDVKVGAKAPTFTRVCELHQTEWAKMATDVFLVPFWLRVSFIFFRELLFPPSCPVLLPLFLYN